MARALGGYNEFVLSSGGHIQTLINPEGGAKSKYFVNPTLVERPDDWLSAAKPVAGSWWEHWRSWLAERSGELRAAPEGLGNEDYPAGVGAPGAYVRAPLGGRASAPGDTVEGIGQGLGLAMHIRTKTIDGQPLRIGIRPGVSHLPPLIVFNGIGASLELVEPFVSALPEREVVTFDVPGSGGS